MNRLGERRQLTPGDESRGEEGFERERPEPLDLTLISINKHEIVMPHTTMHSESSEIAGIKKVDGPVTDNNFDFIIEETPDVTAVFGHFKVRDRLKNTRIVTNQVLTALRVDGFTTVELVQALMMLTELYQVMEPITNNLTEVIKKAFGRK